MMTVDEALEKVSQPWRIPTNAEIALAAEVRRLREENGRLNKINSDLCAAQNRSVIRIARLDEEVESLQKNAERYRHIRQVDQDEFLRFAHYAFYALDDIVDIARGAK